MLLRHPSPCAPHYPVLVRPRLSAPEAAAAERPRGCCRRRRRAPPNPPPPPVPAEADSWSWGPPAIPSPTPPQPTVEAAAAVPLHPQVVAVRSCRTFFASQIEDDDEEENGGNAARFFSELLGSDAVLRGFYEAERDKGRFLCLVCEGSCVRVGKRLAGCAALVQHAGSIARTKRSWRTTRSLTPSACCSNGAQAGSLFRRQTLTAMALLIKLIT